MDCAARVAHSAQTFGESTHRTALSGAAGFLAIAVGSVADERARNRLLRPTQASERDAAYRIEPATAARRRVLDCNRHRRPSGADGCAVEVRQCGLGGRLPGIHV